MTMSNPWRTLTVEECCLRVTSGGTPSRRNPSFYDGGTIPWAKTGELKDRLIDPSRVGEWITEEALAKSSAKLLPKDTVLMAMYGDGQTIGSLGLIRSPISCNQACCAMIPDPSVCDARFLFYALRSYRDNWIKIAHGGAQRNLSGTIIREREILVPPLSTQQRIAAILSAYDDLIENNTRRIAILEEMARRLYDEWFVHFRFPGHEEVELEGELPKGWHSAALGDLVEDKRDAIQPDGIDPDTPYVGLEHIPRRSITLREWSTASTVQSTKLLFVENDILFGKIRPYFHKVSLAPMAGVTSSDTIVLRALSSEYLPLALCCASSDEFVDHATQTSNGTKMPRANWKVLKKYRLVVPDASLLADFNAFMAPLLQSLKAHNRRNANLRAQRDLLLPKLVSGEIDVSDVEARLEAAE